MSFLDRFKIQPKYKSTDPDVRLSAATELGDSDEERAALLALAREDPDARVRRAAAARIEDVGVLADLASVDQDAALRGELVERLAGIAATATAPDAASRALAALTDPKQIVNVARSSTVD